MPVTKGQILFRRYLRLGKFRDRAEGWLPGPGGRSEWTSVLMGGASVLEEVQRVDGGHGCAAA